MWSSEWPARRHLPKTIRVSTSLGPRVAMERLASELAHSPAIEERRHWFTERCVRGAVKGTNVRVDVKYRYLGRVYAWNSFTIGFVGELVEDNGRSWLQGVIDYRLPESTGGLRALRLFAIALIGVAVVVTLEGIASARPDEIAAMLLAVPGVLLYLGIPRLETFVEHRARDDSELLERFLDSTLNAESMNPS
jgi:hypothetical protein